MPDPDAGDGADPGIPPRPPRARPFWWPADEPWPPPRDRAEWRRRGGRAGPWMAAGGPWRRHAGRRIGCAVAALVVFMVGIATVATWLIADVLGLAGVGAPGPARSGQVLVAIAVGAMVLFVLGRSARRVSLPVADLLEAADRLAAGDYKVRLDERGPRELREAARALNTLAERLAATEQRRRALLADVSHELRTPLTVVRGGLEGMLDGLRPRDDAHIAALRDETILLDRLIDDLRTVALAEAGALSLHPEPVDPAGLARDVVAAFEGSAAAAGVTLRAVTGDALPSLQADPARLAEVLRNLVANALRYTPRGGEIVVAVAAEQAPTGRDGPSRAVAFEVRDTGAGLAPGDAERIFDRYQRAADSSGSGLGLAIARELVRLHGGTISASSDGPARGTTIRFTIPALG